MEAAVKLHTLKQSFLISFGISLVSVLMGSDQTLQERGQTPPPADPVIVKGKKAVKNPDIIPIGNSEEFITRVFKLNEKVVAALKERNFLEAKESSEKAPATMVVSEANPFAKRNNLNFEKVALNFPVSLEPVAKFLESRSSKKIECFSQGKSALKSLSQIAFIINVLCHQLIDTRTINMGEKDIIKYYKESGVETVFKYIQKLTQGVLEKIKTISLTPSNTIQGVGCYSLDEEMLYILQDVNGPVPIGVNKEYYQKQKECIFLPYVGIYKEGFLKRGFVYHHGQLITSPGIFIKKYELCIYFGTIRGSEAPFLIRTITKAWKEGEKGLGELILPESKFSNKEEGYFIPVNHTEKMLPVRNMLFDEVFKEALFSDSLELLISIFAAVSEIMSYEEDRKLAEDKRKEALAQKQEKSQKKPLPKKAKERTQKIQKIPATSDQAKGKKGADNSDIQNADNDLEIKPEESNTASESISSELVLRDDMNAEVPDEVGVPKADPNASSIQEEIKENLYDQVMEMVPEGRIKLHF